MNDIVLHHLNKIMLSWDGNSSFYLFVLSRTLKFRPSFRNSQRMQEFTNFVEESPAKSMNQVLFLPELAEFLCNFRDGVDWSYNTL